MGQSILHFGMSATCPHGGQVQVISATARAEVAGKTALRANDELTIVGCLFSTPCVKIQWVLPASRVSSGGQALVHKGSQGLCLNAAQVPQGQAIVVYSQLRTEGV